MKADDVAAGLREENSRLQQVLDERAAEVEVSRPRTKRNKTERVHH